MRNDFTISLIIFVDVVVGVFGVDTVAVDTVAEPTIADQCIGVVITHPCMIVFHLLISS